MTTPGGRRWRRWMLALCLSFWMLPLVAAPNWVQWQAEIARLHRERLPDDIVRERLQSLQARLPPDPPYVLSLIHI